LHDQKNSFCYVCMIYMYDSGHSELSMHFFPQTHSFFSKCASFFHNNGQNTFTSGYRQYYTELEPCKELSWRTIRSLIEQNGNQCLSACETMRIGCSLDRSFYNVSTSVLTYKPHCIVQNMEGGCNVIRFEIGRMSCLLVFF
jgi:hypothetical protein